MASNNRADINNACGEAIGVCVEYLRGGDSEPTKAHRNSVSGGVF